jgi:hypothetical protein
MKRLSLLIFAAVLPMGLLIAAPGMASARPHGNGCASSPPGPTVCLVIPKSGTTAGGKKVTIVGNNFTGATAVNFGSTAAVSFTDSPPVITAVSPPGSGTVNITVTTASGTSPITSSDEYTYVSKLPTVKEIDPHHGPITGGTTVAIVGTNLVGATAVDFGSTPGTIDSVNSEHAIVATSPAGSAGVVDVTVTTPAGTSGVSPPGDQFTYVSDAPTIQSLSPSRGTANGGTKVTIFGDDLLGATAVDFGSTPGTAIDVFSSKSLQVTAPAESAGTVDVTVTTPNGTSPVDPSITYTYVLEIPKVNELLPNSGTTAGGNTVTIGGSNFSKATAVDFGSTPATSFTIDSGKVIVAVAPAGTAGTVTVTVTNPNGTSVGNPLDDQYTYETPTSSD